MRVDDRARNGKAHPEVVGLGRIEGLKNQFEIGRLDTRPGVLDRDSDGCGAGSGGPDNEGGVATPRVAHRLETVEDKVEDYLL